MDICQLICDDQHKQRRRFAILDEIDRSDAETLVVIWARLATFLEVHAASVEKHFYPALLRIGEGAGSKDTPVAETRDGIGDHNDIRDAVAEVALHAVGSDDWYAAITAAREANSDHMAEEERESLADFRRHASLERRHRLAVAFATFAAQHFSGVNTKNRDVGSYVRIHQ
ncbi:MAG: hemerythrin domain-containing protein [Rhodanobacter sp.]